MSRATSDDASRRAAARHDASRSRSARQIRLLDQVCDWCGGPILASRGDAIFCSKSHRQAANRAKIRRCSRERDTTPKQLAYADPPYPGKAGIYRDHPDYAGEVDHAELLSRLQEYDGWALSTSAEALPEVLSLCVARALPVRVAAWDRGERPHPTAHVLNGWEPVVWAPARRVVQDLQTTDVLRGVAPRRRATLPGAVTGMKPPKFCRWMFELIGAAPGDTLDDLFPGSGIVSWSWARYVSDVDRARQVA